MTNTTQTDLLDGVEPDAWLHRQGDYFEPYFRKLDENELARGWTQEPLYSRETVERLLAEHRKQVLLEGAERLESHDYIKNQPAIPYAEAYELRRMALEPTGVDKGEKE